MIDLSTKSIYFILLLALMPFVLRYRSKYRRYAFLAVNILTIVLASKMCLQLVVTAVWVLAPYFASVYLADRKKARPIVITALVVIFAYLAKYDFLFEALHIPYVFVFRILGLSYFLFKEIDYFLQYPYLKEQGYSLNIVDYLNYVLNFYTLMAGPILRYREFADDFESSSEGEGYIPLSKDELLGTVNRIVNGYVKVYVISAVFDHYAHFWFDGIGLHSSRLLDIAAFCVFAYLNCWFIYFNFSGYCDIVIGAAKLSGMTVHENFNKPYMARSVVEFWNRHHITLSEWIRDYIFTPLYKWLLSGPFRKKALAAQAIALFATFVAAGIWHGTTLDYLMYGIFQGLGIVVATLWKSKRKKLLGKERNKKYENSLAVTTVARIVTWGYICLTFSFTGYPVMSLFLK